MTLGGSEKINPLRNSWDYTTFKDTDCEASAQTPTWEAYEWSPEIWIPKSSPNQDQEWLVQWLCPLSIREVEGLPWYNLAILWAWLNPKLSLLHSTRGGFPQRPGGQSEQWSPCFLLLLPDPHCKSWKQNSRTRDAKFAGLFLPTVRSEQLQGLPSLEWGQRQWSQTSKVPRSFRVKPYTNLFTHLSHPQTHRHMDTHPLPRLTLSKARKAYETTYVCSLSYSNIMKSLGICNVRYPISISKVCSEHSYEHIP